MQCRINGPFIGGIDDKVKMAIIFLKTNIPAFHHSIIPFSWQIRKPQNTSVFSINCRNSETFNYTDPTELVGLQVWEALKRSGKLEGTTHWTSG